MKCKWCSHDVLRHRRNRYLITPDQPSDCTNQSNDVRFPPSDRGQKKFNWASVLSTIFKIKSSSSLTSKGFFIVGTKTCIIESMFQFDYLNTCKLSLLNWYLLKLYLLRLFTYTWWIRRWNMDFVWLLALGCFFVVTFLMLNVMSSLRTDK